MQPKTQLENLFLTNPDSGSDLEYAGPLVDNGDGTFYFEVLDPSTGERWRHTIKTEEVGRSSKPEKHDTTKSAKKITKPYYMIVMDDGSIPLIKEYDFVYDAVAESSYFHHYMIYETATRKLIESSDDHY